MNRNYLACCAYFAPSLISSIYAEDARQAAPEPASIGNAFRKVASLPLLVRTCSAVNGKFEFEFEGIGSAIISIKSRGLVAFRIFPEIWAGTFLKDSVHFQFLKLRGGHQDFPCLR